MAKKTLFDMNNVIITLKALATGIPITIVSVFIAMVIGTAYPVVAKLMQLIWAIFSLWLWGYMARTWWNWK